MNIARGNIGQIQSGRPKLRAGHRGQPGDIDAHLVPGRNRGKRVRRNRRGFAAGTLNHRRPGLELFVIYQGRFQYAVEVSVCGDNWRSGGRAADKTEIDLNLSKDHAVDHR